VTFDDTLGVVAAIAGLVLPGFAVGRMLRLSAPLSVAIPFSAILLSAAVLVCDAVGGPIGIIPVGSMLLAGGLVAAGLASLFSTADSLPAPLDPSPRGSPLPAVVWAVAAAGMLTTMVAIAGRLTVFPLTGFDTCWRWENLARLLLTHESLAFYPPRSSADFAIYSYADGIPPLVASTYWWLYACLGRPAPGFTTPLVLAQFVIVGALVWQAARELWGREGGFVAIWCLCMTPLLVDAVAIGQETGWTAIAVAGQIAYGLETRRTGRRGAAIAAGLFAGLACLARDYGPALAIGGLLLLAAAAQSRRLLPWFITTAALVGGPWYIRNWLLTGNPLYSNPGSLGLPVNPVHAAIIHHYTTVLGFTNFDTAKWLRLAGILAGGGIVPLVMGTAGFGRSLRALWPLLVTALVVAALWAWSVGHTAGGLRYSVRVLAPAWVLLAIAAGSLAGPVARWLAARTRPAAIGVAALIACVGLLSTLSAAAHPYTIDELPAAALRRRPDPIDTAWHCDAMLEALEQSGLPACRLLTDDPYMAVVAQRRRSPIVPLMVWDPAVAFLFAEPCDLAACRKQLAALNVRLAFISARSINWGYLSGVPFFATDHRSWKRLYECEGFAVCQMQMVGKP
jgi:hypothetical protein